MSTASRRSVVETWERERIMVEPSMPQTSCSRSPGLGTGAALAGEDAESRTESARKARQAVGIFHDRERLQKALDALAAVGFDEDHLILLGRPASEGLDGRLPWWLENGGADHDPQSAENRVETEDLSEPSCQLGDTMSSNGNGKPSEAIWPKMAQLPSLHADFLKQHLDAGDCLLWVTVHDGDQERKAGALLLQYTEHRVQLHDLS